MFDEIMPDQVYQFLVASSTRGATPSTPLPLPLSFSLHHHHHHHHNVAPFTTFHNPQPPQSPAPLPQTSFDSHPSRQGLIPSSSHFLHHTLLPLQIQQSSHKHENPKEETTLSVSPSRVEAIDPWSNDEVLALLRIRSSMDNNWFHDFTWEDVSRKLGELGFKRSAEKCKEKFEEGTRSFNNNNIINTSNNKNNNVIYNYMLFSELEELCNNSTTGNETPKSSQNKEEEENVEEQDKTGEEGLGDDHKKTKENTKGYLRKRKRQDKFEMVIKGFCESIVNKMMAKQEQLLCKILQDMVDRDEVKIAEEEAWKKQEIERVEMDMKIRAHELAIASDRQSKILDALNKFMSSKSKLEVQSLGEAIENLMKMPNTSSNSLVLSQDCYMSAQPTLSCTTLDQNTSCLMTQKCLNMPTTLTNENLAPLSPNRVDNSKLDLPISSSTIDEVSQNPNPLTIENNITSRLGPISTQESLGFDHTSTNATDQIKNFNCPTNKSDPKPLVENIKDDTGRRWPRDEVLALIDIRCSLFNNSDPNHDRETSGKAPLWERISQKMMELGYKRNAKRCKEKWENINKYFRKTKDLNKKRSIDSRTCPYFHQLSHLYSQGDLLRSTGQSSEQHGSSENGSEPMLIVQEGSGTSTSNSATTTRHGSQGNKGVVQRDFEF